MKPIDVSNTRVGFIGLGVMGYPMAGHLRRQRYKVTVFNRTTKRAAMWVNQYDGEIAGTPAELAAACDIVMLCVGADEDVREMLLGDAGVLAHARPGAIIVDHTTTSAHLAREMGQLAVQKGLHFVDAPVSGGQAGAESGKLTVMAGGDAKVFDALRPVLASYAKMARCLGPVGSGQLAKMVNQVCIAGLVQGLAEGIYFAQTAGLDVAAVIDVISQGAAQSWQMDNRWETMNRGEYNHGFAVDWMRKDLKYVLEEAGRNGIELPVATLVDQFYAEVQQMGGNRWDTSSLLARLNKEVNSD